MGIDGPWPPFHCLWYLLEITSSGSGRASTETGTGHTLWFGGIFLRMGSLNEMYTSRMVSSKL